MNTKPSLPYVEVEAAKAASHTVIWLHGLGADGHDFVPIVPELHLANTRFIFPHAPIMPVTLNQGMKMPAWFDITSLNRDAAVDHAGVKRAIDSIAELIKHEIERGIAAERIMLAGFSQGAVIALCTGLSFNQALGGVIALSGYLPSSARVIENVHPANASLPIFIAHGTQDPVVAFALGEATYQALHAAHFPVAWHAYPITHTVSAAEIKDISDWIKLNQK